MENKTKSGSARIYQDKNGNDTSLWGMLETEPHWILNRFQLMERELENIKELSRWIPVKERLPTDYDRVIVKFFDDTEPIVIHVTPRDFFTATGEDISYKVWCDGTRKQVTHWYPIPELPKGE